MPDTRYLSSDMKTPRREFLSRGARNYYDEINDAFSKRRQASLESFFRLEIELNEKHRSAHRELQQSVE